MKSQYRPILLIDDSDDIRDLFKVWMEIEGYPVKGVRSAEAALELLQGGLEPCILIVDLTLPEMDGATFIQEIRSRELVRGAPVYIFSAHRLLQPIAGSDGVISKPIDIKELLSILAKLDPPCVAEAQA